MGTGDEGRRGEGSERGEEKRGDARGGVERERKVRGDRKREGTQEERGEEKPPEVHPYGALT